VSAALPPADDRLYEPVAFGPGWLVAGIVAVLVASGLVAWALWRPRAPSIVAAPRQLVDLRDRYLRHLGDLEQQLTDDRITPRALHHELSRTLRRFATDAGAVGATAMSATALERAGLGPIADAVRRYEHPQFEELPESDPWAALRIAAAVVSSVDVSSGARAGARA
jgi:hypothetical protein